MLNLLTYSSITISNWRGHDSNRDQGPAFCLNHSDAIRLVFSLVVFAIAITSASYSFGQQATQNLTEKVVQFYSTDSLDEQLKQSPKDIASILASPTTSGYGVIISKDGLVLTNRHLLVEPSHFKYFVRFLAPDDKRPEFHAAELVAADAWVDFAILKIAQSAIPDTGLPFALIASLQPTVTSPRYIVPGNSQPIETLRNGVCAIPPVPLQSRRGRFDSLAYDSHFQYGAMIGVTATEHGTKSGAGVFNPNGELTGITSSLVPAESDSVNYAAQPVTGPYQQIIEQLKQGKQFEYCYLGVRIRELSDEQLKSSGTNGVQVIEVVGGSPADIAGLQFSDVISSVDGITVTNPDEFWRILTRTAVAATLDLKVVRGAFKNEGQTNTFSIRARTDKTIHSTRRSNFASSAIPSWRGLQVEYPFAMPKFKSMIGQITPGECVAISKVDLDSPAWEAGLRHRMVIRLANGQTLTSPADFHEIANQFDNSTVQLTLVDETSGEDRVISVKPR